MIKPGDKVTHKKLKNKNMEITVYDIYKDTAGNKKMDIFYTLKKGGKEIWMYQVPIKGWVKKD